MRISDWSSDVCSSDLVVADVLAGDRPPRDVVADAKAMRDDMAAHKPPAGPLDAKLLPGGLVDLEFAVHVQQLVHRTGFDPHLGRAIDVLAAAGLMPPAMRADRKSVVSGKSVSVRVDLGGRSTIKKKNTRTP